MKDNREDQYLCPECYIPIEYTIYGTYVCGSCDRNWTQGNLVRASELERRIEQGWLKQLEEGMKS